MFHISQLKKAAGHHPVTPVLPPDLAIDADLFEPELIQDVKPTPTADACHQVLVQWRGKPLEEAAWLSCADYRGQFPESNLVDKVCKMGGGNVTHEGPGPATDKPLLVYSRQPKPQV